MAVKEAQINLRLPAELDAWVEAQAGNKRQKPQFVRRILERERARAQEEEMLRMFNEAWDSLGRAEQRELREEREDWSEAYAGGSRR